MKTISILIKPASASCNLHCKYCFYIDEAKNRDTNYYGIMKKETVDQLILRINELFDQENGVANFSFQGGEPTLAGIEFFQYFVSAINNNPNITPHYSIQTNGTLINNQWASFFKKNNFLIGISLDGFEKNTNYFRVDKNGVGAFRTIMNGIKTLERYQNDYNILTVLTRTLAAEPERLLQFYKANQFKYVQIIPCLPELNSEDNGMSLTIKEYADFYIRFFDVWKKEYLKGNIISVNLFENIAAMISGCHPYQCGMLGRCSIQFVLEANGNVFPCDFYCLDEYLLGNIKDDSFAQLAKKGMEVFVSNSACTKQPCQSCQFANMCHGGCRRQNVCYLSDDYCAYQKVLEHIVPQLFDLMKK